MPQLSVTDSDKRLVAEVVRFVKFQGIESLTVEGRMMLAIELNRLMKPELDELRRRAAGVEQKGGAE